MKKIIYLSLFLLIIILILGYFFIYAENRNKDKIQYFELKIGEEAIYKGEYDLELKLVKIEKVKDLGETASDFINENLCREEDGCNILEESYYLLKVKNIDWDICEETGVIISEFGSEIYDCPSFYTFKVIGSDSDEVKVKFNIEYIELTVDI